MNTSKCFLWIEHTAMFFIIMLQANDQISAKRGWFNVSPIRYIIKRNVLKGVFIFQNSRSERDEWMLLGLKVTQVPPSFWWAHHHLDKVVCLFPQDGLIKIPRWHSFILTCVVVTHQHLLTMILISSTHPKTHSNKVEKRASGFCH